MEGRTDHAPQVIPDWAQLPTCPSVDRYLIGPELGTGGRGRVHLGYDPLLRRQVALKLLYGEEGEGHLQCLKEAQAQARLEHPNICPIYDLGQDKGVSYIVMQLIQGKTLAQIRPELQPEDLARIMADVAGAVHAAHREHLIHRDLKPGNILVERLEDHSWKAYVVDFGLARDFAAGELTLSWAVMGTPAFMSPEQARGDHLGPASDIYSLGATLYALLSGHPPFESATLGGLIRLHDRTGLRPLRNENARVPKDLETITHRCLEREPENRYASAFDLEMDLRRWLAGEPITARPVGPMGRCWRWMRRRKELSASLGGALLVITFLAAWNLRTLAQAYQRERAAQRFALEIRDAEHLLRIEHMMPIHDILPAEARMRARMDAIRREMERLGKVARGPGRYAIGRGHLALREPDRARLELEAAWHEGYAAPEVAYALALSLLEQYRLASSPSRQPQLPAISLEGLRERHVKPALVWLARARGTHVDHESLGLAKAAAAQGHWEEAETHFRQALKEAPWLHEAWKELGDIYKRQVDELVDRDASQGFEELISKALACNRSALALAPSDDELYLQRENILRTHYIQKASRMQRFPELLKEAHQAHLQAAQVRPGSSRLAYEGAFTNLTLGLHMLSQGLDPREAVERARTHLMAFAHRGAWASEDEWRNASVVLVQLSWAAADAAWRYGRDPLPDLAHAQAALALNSVRSSNDINLKTVELAARHAAGLDVAQTLKDAEAMWATLLASGEDNAFTNMSWGAFHYEWARIQDEDGQDPKASLDKALFHLRTAVRLNPDMVFAYYHLPRALALQARRSQDPAPLLGEAEAIAQKGITINPRSAGPRLALATVHATATRLGPTSRRPVATSLAACRRAVVAGLGCNPRDYRFFLVLATAEEAAGHGLGPEGSVHLAKAKQACDQGLRVKPDSRALLQLRSRLAAHRP